MIVVYNAVLRIVELLITTAIVVVTNKLYHVQYTFIQCAADLFE